MLLIKSLQLPFYFDPERLQQDLALVAPAEWRPHFNKKCYEGDWSGVSLRSIQGHIAQIYPNPMTPDQYVDTPLMERCPYFREVVSTFKCPLEAVRLLKLAARSNILEHNDYKLGYEDGVIRIHVPVQTNSDVQFFLEDQRIDMKAGESWYLNLNLNHRVDNHSDTDRVHLLIDCVVNDWVNDLLTMQPVLAT